MEELSDTELESAGKRVRYLMALSGQKFYEAGKIISDIRQATKHGRFTKWVKEGLCTTVRTATNMINYVSVVDRATEIGGEPFRKEVLSLRHTIVYDIGSRNISDNARDAILIKIGHGKYETPTDIRTDLSVSNRKRTVSDPNIKKGCVGNLVLVDTTGEDGVVIFRFTSDDGPGECRMPLAQAVEVLGKAINAAVDSRPVLNAAA